MKTNARAILTFESSWEIWPYQQCPFGFSHWLYQYIMAHCKHRVEKSQAIQWHCKHFKTSCQFQAANPKYSSLSSMLSFLQIPTKGGFSGKGAFKKRSLAHARFFGFIWHRAEKPKWKQKLDGSAPTHIMCQALKVHLILCWVDPSQAPRPTLRRGTRLGRSSHQFLWKSYFENTNFSWLGLSAKPDLSMCQVSQ